ncbi:MAG: hypothetical protein M3O35_05645 [Acidobacteriota bacterium]|nr:hypothetical protein [Acidobacteriota bacterium]
MEITAIQPFLDYYERIRERTLRVAKAAASWAHGYENVLAYVDRMHRESVEIFAKLTPGDLLRRCLTPEGTPMHEVCIWRYWG